MDDEDFGPKADRSKIGAHLTANKIGAAATGSSFRANALNVVSPKGPSFLAKTQAFADS